MSVLIKGLNKPQSCGDCWVDAHCDRWRNRNWGASPPDDCPIVAIPAAEVRPVVRGEWLKSPERPEEYDVCSVCGSNDKHRTRGNAEHPAFESIPPFCKWCGADLRGREDGDGDV